MADTETIAKIIDPEAWGLPDNVGDESDREAARAKAAMIQNLVQAENRRLREFIQSLDGKTIAIRSSDNTFIDDGIVVAADILSPAGEG